MFWCGRFILLFMVACGVKNELYTASALEQNAENADTSFYKNDAMDVPEKYSPQVLDVIDRRRPKRETKDDEVLEMSSLSTLQVVDPKEHLTKFRFNLLLDKITDLEKLIQNNKEEVMVSMKELKRQCVMDKDIREAYATQQMKILNESIHEIRALMEAHLKIQPTHCAEITDKNDKYTTEKNVEVTEILTAEIVDATQNTTVENVKHSTTTKLIANETLTTATETKTTVVAPLAMVATTTTQIISKPVDTEFSQKPTERTFLIVSSTESNSTKMPQPHSTLQNGCGKVKGNFDFVGQGYDIQHRVLIKKSPFESIERLKTCHNPPNNKGMDISYTYEVFEDAFQYINYLTQYIIKVSPTENVLIGDKFMSYCTKIYPPGMSSYTSSLFARSWLEEYIILSQELSPDLSSLSNEFMELVDSLPNLDARVGSEEAIPPKVLQVWTSFFNTYGTHVIQFADIGGALKLTLNKEIWNSTLFDINYASQTEKEIFFKTITDKSKFRFIAIGGDNSEIYTAGLIPQAISKWQDSLFERPTLLQSKLKLIPIAKLVTYVRPILQKTVEALMKAVYTGSVETLEGVYKESNGLRQKCDLDHWNACPLNSKCMRNGSNSVCLCGKDFIESNGNCSLANWSPCNFRLECNHLRGFNCVMGHCKCLVENSYDSETESCLSSVGQKCGWWIINNEREWHHVLCQSGLQCSRPTRGTCFTKPYN